MPSSTSIRRTLSTAHAKLDTDLWVSAALFVLTFTVYLRTLAPSVSFIFDDTLEYQLLAPRMAIAHPTGYPTYSLILKLFTFVPLGDIAFRVNLASAVFAALAVVMVYLAARQLVESRGAALTGGLVVAFSEAFWSRAVIAEGYTFQALLTAAMLWLVLSSRFEVRGSRINLRLRTLNFGVLNLDLLAFFYGLMFTHHRMSALLFPALAVYVLAYDRTLLHERRTLLKMGAAFLLPLLLYLYLPLRGLVTSSLDGTYQNTPLGFLSWIMGSSYTVFLTQNPLNQNRDAIFYLDLFLREFTPAGLLLATFGFLTLARNRRKEWVLLSLGLIPNLFFAFSYNVANVTDYFIPSFLFLALFCAVGADALLRMISRVAARVPSALRAAAPGLALLLLLLIPASLVSQNYVRVDLSSKWDVHDYGRDILTQALPPNATLIGILGEMSLVRYFQETENLRPAVQTVAADKEAARLAAIAAALQAQRVALLTRPLSGAESKYSLTSFGPLILVQPKSNRTTPPSPSHPLDRDFDGVTLIGYDLDLSRLNDVPGVWHLENGRRIRVTLYWHVEHKISDDRLVSLKLLASDGTLGAQMDRHPVLDAYRTTAWRSGEFLTDTYDLPVFMGARPGPYTLQVTLYNPESGDVKGQAALEQIVLSADTHYHSLQSLDVDHVTRGDRPVAPTLSDIELEGYSLDSSEAYHPGDSVPITLLWRVAEPKILQFNLRLKSVKDAVLGAQPFSVGESATSGQYVRQEISFGLPATLADGSYELGLELFGYSFPDLPLLVRESSLGDIQVAH